MTIKDMEYVKNKGNDLLVKDMPLGKFIYTDGTDGDAKYDIYFATIDRFCFFQAWENANGTLRFYYEKSDYGTAYSVKKDNVLDLPLIDAHEGVGYFTVDSEENEIVPGTSEENDFREHKVYSRNPNALIKTLEGMSLPVINGCKVSETFSAGFVNFYLGEVVGKPGRYKVWRQNPKDTSPAWEKTFTSKTEARLYQLKKGLELAEDQKKRTEGLGMRKKMKELEY